MSSAPNMPEGTPVDRYLDLPPGDGRRAELEREIKGDPRWRRELELTLRVEESLQRQLAMPRTLAGAVGRAGFPGSGSRVGARAGSWARAWWLYAAAAALVVISGAIVVVSVGAPAGRASPASTERWPRPVYLSQIEGMYYGMVRAGFTPEWVCKDDAEFAGAVRDRLGQPLLVHADETIQVVGWAYGPNHEITAEYASPPISDDTMILLSRVDGEEVLTFLDRSDAPEPELRVESHLRLFSKVVGGLRAWELTPLESPAILDRLYVPTP